MGDWIRLRNGYNIGSMLDASSRHLARMALVPLAVVASSYHLTSTARLQAEVARQRRQAARHALAPTNDKQDDKSKPPHLLEWLAPDMLDRTGGRALDPDESIRLSVFGSPGLLSEGWRTSAPLLRPDASGGILLEVRGPVTLPHLGDRQIHGPPSHA
jgi:hypothetical protein